MISMEFNEFETRIAKAKGDCSKNKKKYDFLSIFSTIMAVLAPILISQTSFFTLRITGAILLLLNYPITSKMEKYFLEWLGDKRYYDFLRLEYFEFRSGLDHYLGLNPEEMTAMVLSQLNNIHEESKNFKEIMDISPKHLKDNITGLKEKVNGIATNLKEAVKTFNSEYPQNAIQLRFEHYIKNRYLDQLTWFYKRINPIKEELKEQDIKKSVYFNFMKNETKSKIFKFISVALTILSNEYLLGFVGLANYGVLLTIIVLAATIVSIISSFYSEKDKIQKNSETTLNYLQTIKSLTMLYDSYYDELIGKMNDESSLEKLEHAFVRKTESILMQESIKWGEIQHTKSD